MALAFATLLLLAGCSGGKEGNNPQDHGAEVSQDYSAEVSIDHGAESSQDHGAGNSVNSLEISEVQQPRKEFAIMREIVRQHGLQTDNEKRMEAIATVLKAKFPLLPDKGETEEEKRIYREAEALFRRL
jgi:hypothetical protein